MSGFPSRLRAAARRRPPASIAAPASHCLLPCVLSYIDHMCFSTSSREKHSFCGSDFAASEKCEVSRLSKNIVAHNSTAKPTNSNAKPEILTCVVTSNYNSTNGGFADSGFSPAGSPGKKNAWCIHTSGSTNGKPKRVDPADVKSFAHVARGRGKGAAALTAS
jgi:hypothetical protein